MKKAKPLGGGIPGGFFVTKRWKKVMGNFISQAAEGLAWVT